jgi:serine kinase of HPr protein (carbohydrate metabolism regulator)
LPLANIHATALVLGDRGVLIRGASGSGKTTLALALIAAFQSHGRFARLVGDDQLFATERGGRLLVQAPVTIAGLAEIRGIGPHPLPFLPRAVIDRVVWLVLEAEAPRFADPRREAIAGVELPRLDLAARNAAAAAPAVTAWMETALQR